MPPSITRIDELRSEVNTLLDQASSAQELMQAMVRLLPNRMLKYNWVGFYMLEPGAALVKQIPLGVGATYGTDDEVGVGARARNRLGGVELEPAPRLVGGLGRHRRSTRVSALALVVVTARGQPARPAWWPLAKPGQGRELQDSPVEERVGRLERPDELPEELKADHAEQLRPRDHRSDQGLRRDLGQRRQTAALQRDLERVSD